MAASEILNTMSSFFLRVMREEDGPLFRAALDIFLRILPFNLSNVFLSHSKFVPCKHRVYNSRMSKNESNQTTFQEVETFKCRIFW